MKRLWLLGFLCLAALSGSAFTKSTVSEILPGEPGDDWLQFEIRSESLSDGSTRFTVLVTEKSPKVEDRWHTSLGILKIKIEPPGVPLAEARTQSIESTLVRELPAERQGSVIQCIFSVTQSELRDSDLCFFFSVAEKPPIPAVDIFYARLRKFLPPVLGKPSRAP